MSRQTTILLALTIIDFVAGLLFVSGWVGVGRFPGLYATFPIGATCYGLFLISRMLEKEVAAFDAEQRAQRDRLMADNPSSSAKSIRDHGHPESIRAEQQNDAAK